MWHPMQLLRQLPATAINIGWPSFHIGLFPAIIELSHRISGTLAATGLDECIVDLLLLLLPIYILVALPLLVSMVYGDYHDYKAAQRYAETFATVRARYTCSTDDYSVFEVVWGMGVLCLRALRAGCSFFLGTVFSLVTMVKHAFLGLVSCVTVALRAAFDLVFLIVLRPVGRLLAFFNGCVYRLLYALCSKCTTVVNVLSMALVALKYQVMVEGDRSMSRVMTVAIRGSSERLTEMVLYRPSLPIGTIVTTLRPSSLPQLALAPLVAAGPLVATGSLIATGHLVYGRVQKALVRLIGSYLRTSSFTWAFYGFVRACDLPKALSSVLRLRSSTACLFVCGFAHLDLITKALTLRVTVYQHDRQSFDLTVDTCLRSIAGHNMKAALTSYSRHLLTSVRRMAISAVSASSTVLASHAHTLINTGHLFVRRPLRLLITSGPSISASIHTGQNLIQACGISRPATLSLTGLTATDLLAAFRYLSNVVRPSPTMFSCRSIQVYLQTRKFVVALATFRSESSLQAVSTQPTTIRDSGSAESSLRCLAVPYGPQSMSRYVSALPLAQDVTTTLGNCFMQHEVWSAYVYGHLRIRPVRILFQSGTILLRHLGEEVVIRVNTHKSNAIRDSEVLESSVLSSGNLEITPARLDLRVLEVTPPVLYGPQNASELLPARVSGLDTTTLFGRSFQPHELLQAFAHGYFPIHEVKTLFTSSVIRFEHGTKEIAIHVHAYQRPLEITDSPSEDTTLFTLPSATITEVSDDFEDLDLTLCDFHVEDLAHPTDDTKDEEIPCTSFDFDFDFEDGPSPFATSMSCNALDELLRDDTDLEPLFPLDLDLDFDDFETPTTSDSDNHQKPTTVPRTDPATLRDILRAFQETPQWENEDKVPAMLFSFQGIVSAKGEDGIVSATPGRFECAPSPSPPPSASSSQSTVVERTTTPRKTRATASKPSTASGSGAGGRNARAPAPKSKATTVGPASAAQQPQAGAGDAKKSRPRKRPAKKAVPEPSAPAIATKATPTSTSTSSSSSRPSGAPSTSASSSKTTLATKPKPTPTPTPIPSTSTSTAHPAAGAGDTGEVRLKSRGPRTPSAIRRQRRAEREEAAERAAAQAQAAAA